MSIANDMLAMGQIQNNFKISNGRYIQALPTPKIIPKKGDITTFIKLERPHDETEDIYFEPEEKDYQFRIDVWTRLWDQVETSGYIITAVRDLGNGIIEAVTKRSE